MTVDLPAGIEHGTPEGFANGCRTEKDCPALHTHGMVCLYAHLRSTTDPRYYKAKTRDPRPAAIAARLGIKPPALAEVAKEAALDEKRAAPKPSTPKPAQPLVERAQDTVPQEDAGVPVVEEETMPAIADPLVEVEAMGHPETPEPEEIPVTDTTSKSTPGAPSPVMRKLTAQERAREELMSTAKGRATVRAWAVKEGFEIGAKGHIPGGVVAAYMKAQPGEGAQPKPKKPAKPAPRKPAAPKPLPAPEFSEALEQVRDRVDAPAPTTPADIAEAFEVPGELVTVPQELTYIGTVERTPEPPRPDFGEAMVDVDVERARSLAICLEAENALLLGQVEQAHRAVEITLTLYTDASDALAEVRRDLRGRRVLYDLAVRRNATIAGELEAMTQKVLDLSREADTARAALAESRSKTWWKRVLGR